MSSINALIIVDNERQSNYNKQELVCASFHCYSV